MITDQTILITAGAIGSICIIAAGIIAMKAYRKAKKIIKMDDVRLDFGLATKEEVLEKYGNEIGQVILEERQIVFWNFGWFWAVFGAVVYQVIRLLLAMW